MSKDWQSVSRSKPCPICKRPNKDHSSTWCSMLRDGSGVRCMFVESKHRSGDGWMHWLEAPTNGQAVRRNGYERSPRIIDLQWLAEAYRKAATNALIVTLAKSLGVTFEALRRLNVGWDGEAYTWPMYDAACHIVGIRRRLPDGKKLSVKGGHEGLFVPHDLNGESPIWICEGPTDTSALLGLGLPAIGRPSCTGGVKYIVELCAGRRVVIVADADTPGLRGARELRAKLVDAVVIVPPDGSKDIREFVRNTNATRETIEALIPKSCL